MFYSAQAQKNNWIIYYTATECVSPVLPEYYNLFSPKEIASDLASQLEKATSMKFKTEEFRGNKGAGIYLLLDSLKEYKSNEHAYINSDNQSYITITARYANGISYGVYTMLNRLGFRYYLPGDNWTIVPPLKSFFYGKLQTSYNPAFKDRAFFSYFPSVKGIDEEGRNKKLWLKWCQRNRMGSDYLFLNGHVGESYNSENVALLKKEPDRLAPVEGRREYSVAGKIDPTSKRSVEHYTDWAVNKYQGQRKIRSSCFPPYLFQSVDMGDGLGYCHTPECERAFASVSDQSFHIANIAAKKIKKAGSNAFVNLYAYNERADTPLVPLEKNVFTQVISDGYQFISSSAMLMKKWSLKTSNFSSYAYLNEAPWVYDQPFYDLKEVLNRLTYARTLGSKGYTFETSVSKFSAGLPQYFILKYLCDPYEDLQKEMNLFYSECFNSCKAPIQKLFDVWYLNSSYTHTSTDRFTFMKDDLAKLWTYIDEASRNKNSGDVKLRIEELKIYFIYLVKLFELQNNPREIKKMFTIPGYTKIKFNETLNYIWHYNNTLLFHNEVLSDQLISQLQDPETSQAWNMQNGNIPKSLKKFPDISTDQLFNQCKNLLSEEKNNEPFNTLPDSVLTVLSKLSADSIRIQLADAEVLIGYTGYFDIYNPVPGKITISYKFTPDKNLKNNIGFISVTSDDYKEVMEKQIFPSNKTGSVTFMLGKKGHYNLMLGQNKYTPATFIIKPGKSLLYIHKKVLPTNSILLTDTTGKPLDNAYLGLYVGANKSLNFHGIYYDCPNTFHFTSASGKILSPIISGENPLYGIVIPDTDVLFFKSDFFRWPPVFSNFNPYFFYLKKWK